MPVFFFYRALENLKNQADQLTNLMPGGKTTNLAQVNSEVYLITGWVQECIELLMTQSISPPCTFDTTFKKNYGSYKSSNFTLMPDKCNLQMWPQYRDCISRRYSIQHIMVSVSKLGRKNKPWMIGNTFDQSVSNKDVSMFSLYNASI